MNNDLEQLIADATPFNALPLLIHVLSRDNVSVRQSISSLSRTQYIHNYLSNTLILRELKDVIIALAERDMKVILLKGAALTLDLYHDPGLRPMRDADLLIHRKDLARVMEIMYHLGYRYYRPPARAGTENTHGAVTCIKDAEFPVVIEPHWTLGPEYYYSGRIQADGLWQRATRINLDGIDTLALCPEDSLLHLCLHRFQHCQNFELIPACDITELIRHYKDSLDWRAFLNRVVEFELCFPVRYSLKRTSEVFHLPVPSFVFNELNSYKPGRLEHKLFTLLSSQNNPRGTGILIKLLTIPGIGQKIRYLGSVLFPSREWLVSYYSCSSTRPLSLYARHMKNAVLTGIEVIFRFIFRGK
jgi:hypothetical protein